MPAKKTAATVSSTPAPPRPYLLSSKTRAQVAASQSSSVPLAPVGVMSESSSSSPMPVPSAPVIATSVPLVPESSPSKKADLNELAASAAKNLVNILASPSSLRSASSVTSPSPVSVGGNSRASISPGKPSHSLEMQQMMQMMQQQMRDMMKNVEENVMRSINNVSNDVMKRVTDLMHQHDDEITLKVNKMVSASTDFTHAPSITLDDNTTLHDYAEDDNSSLHGSRNEGFIYKATINDEDDSEDECKYDVPDQPVHRRTEFPLDAEESRVKRREVNNPDREVMVDIDDDETHLTDYVQWLKRRERLYPFGDTRCARLYKPRHDLLSHKGRELEYSRFAFLTSWDKRLFGEVANRWFKRLLHDAGVAKATDGKPPRPVSIHLVRVPEMSYDTRDRLIRGSDEEGRDLPNNSFTLSELPARLRVPPYEDAARLHHRTLLEEADSYVYQRRLAMIARGELEENDVNVSDTSTSDSASVASHDHRTCRRCDKLVYGLVDLCQEHQEEYTREKRDNEQRQDDLRRKEQALREQREKQTTVTANIATPGHAAVSSTMDTGARFSIGVSPYGTPVRDTSKHEAGLNRVSAPPTHAPTPVLDMPKLVAESGLHNYQVYDRVKQEEEMRATRQKKEEYERVSMLSDIDKYEEATSVLGSILSRAFTPEMRRMMRYSKLPTTIKLTGKDRIAAISEMKVHGITFSGERLKAAFYLRRLCTTIIRYDLSVGEVYQTMSLTMTGQAESWLQSEWYRCGEIPEHMKPVQALLEGFMDKWMDNITRTMYRDSLRSLKMLSESATVDDLNKHYAKFNELLTGLRMCDRHVDMRDIKYEFFKSLPNKCKSFIGDIYAEAESVDEIHKKAERALVTLHSRTTPPQDGDMAEVIGLNALTHKSGPKKDSETVATKPQSKKFDVQQAYSRNERRDITCWHCGDKGHYAGVECPLIEQNQTRRGQAAWALANKSRYEPRQYDKNYFIQRSKQGAQARTAASTTQASTTPVLANGRRRKDNRRLMRDNGNAARSDSVELDDEEEQSSQ
jgi:TolA-binding protein